MLKTEYIEDMTALMGDDVNAYMQSLEKEPCRGLFPNTLRMEKDKLAGILEKAGIKLCGPVPWSEGGMYYAQGENTAVRPGNHVLHEAGFYYIQEPSAMLPATCFSPGENERVLDLCAAPGGKSVQLATAMKGRGLLVSNEIIPSRAAILSENIERMGITNAIVTNESPDSLSRRFPLYFDKILVDAPCSGEGMFRKNPEAMDQWSRENVALCAQRQKDILEKADIMLRPGGTLVYSTCTFAYEENEGMILSFMKEHPLYRLMPVPLSGGMVCGITAPGDEALSERSAGVAGDPYDIRNAARIYPHRSDGEGHFACVLIKGSDHENTGACSYDRRNLCMDSNTAGSKTDIKTEKEIRKIKEKRNKGGKNKKKSKDGDDAVLLKAAALAGEFLRLVLCDDDLSPVGSDGAYTADQDSGRAICVKDHKHLSARLRKADCDPECLFMMGKQLYLLPEGAPDLQGLKILRAGLHLGSMEKDRFEPSMSLARALSVYDINNYVNYSYENDQYIDISCDRTEPLNPDISNKNARPLLVKYFEGQALDVNVKKGWCLVCADGLGIGWGKVTDGILKNHYPKGLRKKLQG